MPPAGEGQAVCLLAGATASPALACHCGIGCLRSDPAIMQQPGMLIQLHAPLRHTSRCRHWGAVAFALMPQLCRLAEALGQGATARQTEALRHLLRCLRSLALMGQADEAVRAGGGRLLSVTAAAFLVRGSGRALSCWAVLRCFVAVQHANTPQHASCAHSSLGTAHTSMLAGAP